MDINFGELRSSHDMVRERGLSKARELFKKTKIEGSLSHLILQYIDLPNNEMTLYLGRDKIREVYYTAARHDPLRNWLVPLLYKHGISENHLDWLIWSENTSFFLLWRNACIVGKADVIACFDPAWEGSWVLDEYYRAFGYDDEKGRILAHNSLIDLVNAYPVSKIYDLLRKSAEREDYADTITI